MVQILKVKKGVPTVINFWDRSYVLDMKTNRGMAVGRLPKEKLIIQVEQLLEWKELIEKGDVQTVKEQLDDVLKMAE